MYVGFSNFVWGGRLSSWGDSPPPPPCQAVYS